MSWKLYDYVGPGGKNIFKKWTEKLQTQQLARLNQKLDMLEKHGVELPPKILTDTKITHIMEIVIKGNVALRPLLCKGPTKNDEDGNYNKEFTLLYGARERDNKYVPKDALIRAEKHRQEVIKNPNKMRCSHERVQKKNKK